MCIPYKILIINTAQLKVEIRAQTTFRFPPISFCAPQSAKLNFNGFLMCGFSICTGSHASLFRYSRKLQL